MKFFEMFRFAHHGSVGQAESRVNPNRVAVGKRAFGSCKWEQRGEVARGDVCAAQVRVLILEITNE